MPTDIVLNAALQVLSTVDIAITENRLAAPVRYPAAPESLSRPWRGRMLLQVTDDGMLGQWVSRLLQEYKRGAVTEAVAILPATPAAGWYYLTRSTSRCFIDGTAPALEQSELPYPLGVVYLGPNTSRFLEVFSVLGEIDFGEPEDAPLIQVRVLGEADKNKGDELLSGIQIPLDLE